MKVPHMKIVSDQKRKKIMRKGKKSGRHTLVVGEKPRIKKKIFLGGCKIMVSCNFKINKNEYCVVS